MPLTGARSDWLQRAEAAAMVGPGRAAWYSDAQVLQHIEARIGDGIDQLDLGISPMQHLIVAVTIRHAMERPGDPWLSAHAIRKQLLPPHRSDDRGHYPQPAQVRHDIRSIGQMGWLRLRTVPGPTASGVLMAAPSDDLMSYTVAGSLIQRSINRRMDSTRAILLKQEPGTPMPLPMARLVNAACGLREWAERSESASRAA